jgi:tetratricopeptide (TPR) repeat protein
LIARSARLACAAGALALAAAAGRTWHAERAFERGVHAVDPRTGEPAIDGPSRDVPGRLESYREAAALDPRQGVFALRRGQIALLRAARTPPSPDAAERLAEAETALADAARLLPLDARSHDALAQAALLRGDFGAAVRESRLAVRLAPRRKSGLESCVRRCLLAWRRTSDPDALGAALEALLLAFELEDGRDPEFRTPHGPAGLARFEAELRTSDGPALDDLLLAVRGRPDLARTAARLVEPVRPGDAATLRAAAGEARE